MSAQPEQQAEKQPEEGEHPAGYTAASKASLWRTVVSIAWAFFGVRKGSDYHDDIKKLNIFHIIFVGIAGCFLLVIGLMAIAHWATASL